MNLLDKSKAAVGRGQNGAAPDPAGAREVTKHTEIALHRQNGKDLLLTCLIQQHVAKLFWFANHARISFKCWFRLLNHWIVPILRSPTFRFGIVTFHVCITHHFPIVTNTKKHIQ